MTKAAVEWELKLMRQGTKPPRKRVLPDNETAVLMNSARRCPLCYYLSGDLAEKVGQISHLDGDRTNRAEDNLAWMCMPHHSMYDSTTSQHKNYTIREVKAYRTRLYAAIERGERGITAFADIVSKGNVQEISESDRYLSSTDEELSSAIKKMAWVSAWGKWFVAQCLAYQDIPIGRHTLDGEVMRAAAYNVTEAAMDGQLEIRGRPPTGISYEPIPREAWRLTALHMIPDLRVLWRAIVIPRGEVVGFENGKLQNKPPSRVAHIFEYDSLIVESRQFEKLWPKAHQATDKARGQLLQTAEEKGIVDQEMILGLRR
jgi:hypothetical protein